MKSDEESATNNKPDETQDRLCINCIADTFWLHKAEEEAAKTTCCECGEVELTVSLDDVVETLEQLYPEIVEEAESIVDVDSDNFAVLEGGEPPYRIIAELLESNESLGERISDRLHDRNWRDAVRGGADYYRLDTEHYQIRRPSAQAYRERWEAFVRDITYRRRFFNDDARTFLRELFEPLLRGDLTGGKPPLVNLGSEDLPITRLFRGRVANTREDQEDILRNPQRELSAPPGNKRPANRMNAIGVLAFYSCSDIPTCIAELRVPVGGAAVIGAFDVTEPLRLLDLRRLAAANTSISYFDPQYEDKSSYLAFIRLLHDELRRPVMPEVESLDYLPTQVLAEFLAGEVDGILFASSQVEHDEDELRLARSTTGLNIVLLASRALAFGGFDKQSLSLREGLHGGLLAQYDGHAALPIRDFPAWEQVYEAVEPVLRLDEDSVEIVEVESVKYTTCRTRVHYYPDRPEADAADLFQP